MAMKSKTHSSFGFQVSHLGTGGSAPAFWLFLSSFLKISRNRCLKRGGAKRHTWTLQAEQQKRGREPHLENSHRHRQGLGRCKRSDTLGYNMTILINTVWNKKGWTWVEPGYMSTRITIDVWEGFAAWFYTPCQQSAAKGHQSPVGLAVPQRRLGPRALQACLVRDVFGSKQKSEDNTTQGLLDTVISCSCTCSSFSPALEAEIVTCNIHVVVTLKDVWSQTYSSQ